MKLNERAERIADELAAAAPALAGRVHRVGDARVIDVGVEQTGSIEAGMVLARICLADLGTVSAAGAMTLTGASGVAVTLPSISVHVAHPVAACMASQYAGWQISAGKYFAMGSGPMRAARGKEDLFDDIGHRESSPCAVGVLETSALPTKEVIDKLTEACGVRPERLTLAAARTASLAGGVQVVARSVETALHKLHELKFDLDRIVAGFGLAPLPPVAADDMTAIGRTNDAMLYGARCVLYVRGDDASLIEIGAMLPSSSSRDYGKPFAEIFSQYDHDFYKIDPMLFSPASVTLQNVETGTTRAFGKIDDEVLATSLLSY
ncbi:MAG: methenyltetrahydromethanopterin cyclohydrolase [Phycisphaeraceae bacterium]|nr:methenyltetrahydromethanopterin cyclohydrolase [Phycisphaeraceae bacterium]